MRSLFILAAALMLPLGLAAETRVVSSTTKGKTETFTTEIRETQDGAEKRVFQKSEDGSAELLVRDDGTVSYCEVQTKDGTMRMVSDGKFVAVSGTWKGKALGGRCDQKGQEFFGSGFEYALRALAKRNLPSLKFVVIQPSDSSKANVMELSREGSDTFQGKKAIKVKVGLAGLMAAFWSAHFLMGEDGTLLRYVGNQGPGTPDMVTELIEIRS